MVKGVLENARVAAEGLERLSQTREKRRQAAQGEAEPEAVLASSTLANMPMLADWLAIQLTQTQMSELLDELSKKEVNHG